MPRVYIYIITVISISYLHVCFHIPCCQYISISSALHFLNDPYASELILNDIIYSIQYTAVSPCLKLTSHLKGFSPECCRECTFRDMLRLNDFPHVSHVNGMSFVWAAGKDTHLCTLTHVYCISCLQRISHITHTKKDLRAFKAYSANVCLIFSIKYT